MSSEILVTPNPAKVGDTLVVVGRGIGTATRRSYTTVLSGTDVNLTYTATKSGTTGTAVTAPTITYAVTSATGAAIPLSIAVNTTGAVVVTLQQNANATALSTAQQIRDAVNNNTTAAAFLTAALPSGQTALEGVPPSMTVQGLTGGTNTTGAPVVTFKLIQQGGGAAAVITETVTNDGSGNVFSAGDFTYEADRPGVHKFLLQEDGVVTAEADVQVWSV